MESSLNWLSAPSILFFSTMLSARESFFFLMLFTFAAYSFSELKKIITDSLPNRPERRHDFMRLFDLKN